MGEILMRAACFILIIILGHVLRRIGFFKKDDFYVLSKTVLKITLPAAIISNMNGMKKSHLCWACACWALGAAFCI